MTLRTTPPLNIQLKTMAQRRARIKPDMKAKLEVEYRKNPKPSKSDKHRMALTFEMTDENVHFWFQNRRARASRESKRSSSTNSGPSVTYQATSHSLGSSSGPASNPSTQLCRLSTSATTNTLAPSHPGPKPCLPHIFTLWEDADSSKNDLVSMYDESHTSFISSYFHHSPFGIQSSYLKWLANEDVDRSN